MFNLSSATRFIVTFGAIFLLFSSFISNNKLSAQVAIQSFDTKSGSAATVHSLTGVPAGALLVLTTSADNTTGNSTVSSTPAITWTNRADASASGSGDAEIYTAVFAAGGNITVTSNWGSKPQASVCYVVINQEGTLGGNSNFGVSQSAPSVSITTTRANSILFCVTSDWNAMDGASRAYRSTPTERLYYRAAGSFTSYNYFKDAPTISSYTVGLTAPTGQTAGTAVLEIRGSADTQSPTVSITAPAAGNVSGTINADATASDNVGVAGVQFLLDGVNLGAEDVASPYSVSWNTTTATNGSHTLTARARDAAGNTTTSAGVVVTVNNADSQSPTVSITAPAAGNVSGTINADATASDNVGVAGVQFLLDGVNLGAEDVASPYSVSWNTTTATNGSHTLTARARDAAGNTTTSAGVVVTVNNADSQSPTVNLTAPSAGNVSGTINADATASDNVGVAGVQFLLDGVNLGAEDVASPYSVSWNTTTATNGSHTLTVRARDAAGNTTTSAGVIVTVNNDTQVPVVSITAPATGTVSGTINVDANASDNVGVTGVQFMLNGVNLGAEDITAPYSISWNTSTSANGTYTLTARARDAAGNTAISTGVIVTVYNAAGTYWSLTGNAGTNPATNFLGTTDAQRLVFKTNNTEKATIDAAGNLGIGTNAPQYKLDVNGTGRFTGNVIMPAYNTTATSLMNTGASTAVIATTTGGTSGINISDNVRPSLTLDLSGVVARGIGIINSNGDIALNIPTFSGANTHIFYGNGKTYLSNDVGIGVLNPSARLHTLGTIRFEGLTNNDALTRILATDASGNVSWRNASTLGSGGSGVNTMSAIGSSSNANAATINGSTLTLQPANASFGGVITTGTQTIAGIKTFQDKVGIGTINTSDANYKLFVETGIRTRKVKVDQTTWPDYVFHQQYKLPTLKEVEEFIQKNKHLPDVPSATEVEKNGLDLGDNQSVLLKKIEELTLYLIEINKKVEKLTEENEILKRKLEIKKN